VDDVRSFGGFKMNMVKSLLLGSAAGLAALTGAQAADLPVKAKPVEYVKICSLYGAGFYYIPGTDTCIRIGGHIRAEINFNAGGSGQQAWGVAADGRATQTRDRDFFTTRTRGYLFADTRTQTSYGTLRTFQTYRLTADTPAGTAGVSTAINLDNAIVQWAGFTIGRLGPSFLDSPYVYSTNYLNGHLGSSDQSPNGFVLAYTHQFGNGISGSIALEDPKHVFRPTFNGSSIAGGANLTSLPGVLGAPDSRGGNTWPDIIGQFRVDQAWGGFHLAGLVRNKHVSYGCAGQVGCTEVTGLTPSDKVGGAVNAGLKINVPTGVNDALYFGASYAVGMTNGTFGSSNHSTIFGLYGSSGIRYGSVQFTPVFDSVYNTSVIAGALNPTGAAIGPSGQQLTTTYGGNIQFEHGWNAEWRTSVFGGVEKIDYNTTANAILCSQYRPGSAAGTLSNFNTTCNMDYTMWGVGSRTTWTPVRDLLIGAEVLWTQHHGGNNGATYLQPAINNFKPIALYEVRDQNVLSGMFSVRRFF
jgi:hypothetical protein